MENQEKKERLCEAASILLDATPNHQLNIVVLNKALFYSDLVALRDHGETFTGNTYLALKNGPVVANYPRRLIRPLQSDNIAVQIEDGESKPLKLVQLPELKFCTGPWLKLFRQFGNKFAKLTSSRVSRLSHENLGWRSAWRRGGATGGAPLPIDMNIAMQQLDGSEEDDLWMKSDLTDNERRLVEAAGSTDGTDW